MAYTTHVMCTTASGAEMTARAIDFVERYCSLTVTPTVLRDEVDGGHQSLDLKHGPLIAIISVDDMYLDENIPAQDNWRQGAAYRASADTTGILGGVAGSESKVIATGGRYWARGANRFRVIYEAGYDELPVALELLIEEIERYIAKWSGSEGLKREQFGSDYAWEAALAIDAEMAPLMQRLNLWRRL